VSSRVEIHPEAAICVSQVIKGFHKVRCMPLWLQHWDQDRLEGRSCRRRMQNMTQAPVMMGAANECATEEVPQCCAQQRRAFNSSSAACVVRSSETRRPDAVSHGGVIVYAR
jgi:hypothetical protein